MIPADNVNFNNLEKIAREVSDEFLTKESMVNLRQSMIEGKEQIF
jgi:hypothetical protein